MTTKMLMAVLLGFALLSTSIRAEQAKYDDLTVQEWLELRHLKAPDMSSPKGMASLFSLFRKHAAKDSWANVYLYHAALNGDLGKKEMTTPERYLEKAATQGNPYAAFVLARIAFRRGNAETAVRWGEIAVKGRVTSGYMYLGLAKKALADPTGDDIIRMGAEGGDPLAMFAIGSQLIRSKMTNPSAAFRWMKRAAEAPDRVASNIVVRDKTFGADAPLAVFSVGDAYANGTGVERNIPLAIEWLTRATLRDSPNDRIYYDWLALDGVAAAYRELGSIYENEPTLRDMNKALAYHKKAAERNDPIAMERAALLLLVGKDVEHNPSEARRLYEMASTAVYEAGSGVGISSTFSQAKNGATFGLGKGHLLGEWPDTNVDKGIQILEMVANTPAEYGPLKGLQSGNILAGYYWETNRDLAKTWYERNYALLQGIPVAADGRRHDPATNIELDPKNLSTQNAAVHLSIYYQDKANYREVIRWNEEYDKHQEDRANTLYLRQIGDIYSNRKFDGYDLKKAAEYYKASADRGDYRGYAALGTLKLAEKGAKVTDYDSYYQSAYKLNPSEAPEYIAASMLDSAMTPDQISYLSKWLDLAANVGSVDSKALLGHILINGLGGERDPKRGAKLVTESFNKGSQFAKGIVGVGKVNAPELFSESKESAFTLLTDATKDGAKPSPIPAAYTTLASMYLQGTNGAPIDYATGLDLLKKGAEEGDKDSLYWIAKAFRQGLGVPADRDTALTFAKLSKGYGSPEGANLLKAIEDEIAAEEKARQAEAERTRRRLEQLAVDERRRQEQLIADERRRQAEAAKRERDRVAAIETERRRQSGQRGSGESKSSGLSKLGNFLLGALQVGVVVGAVVLLGAAVKHGGYAGGGYASSDGPAYVSAPNVQIEPVRIGRPTYSNSAVTYGRSSVTQRELEIRPQYNNNPTARYGGSIDSQGNLEARNVYTGNKITGSVDQFGDGKARNSNGTEYRIKSCALQAACL